jgi:predicted dienelactone hydrolase
VGDVSAVIDQLEKWNDKKGHALKARLDLDKIGMSGHSFGAVTTQHIGGQVSFGGPAYADNRISAAIPMSPSSPRAGGGERAFGKIKMPWLCMTGTHDTSLIGGASVKSRLAVYSALPAGDKYHLVLKNAEHSAFTENKLFGDKLPRNPNHHRAIKAISTAFWESYLSKDGAAKKWLSADVRSVLEDDDQWEKK